MKKTLILGLVALMLFLPLIALTACTSENDDTNNDEITNQNENDVAVFQQSEWPTITNEFGITDDMNVNSIFAMPSYARHFEDLVNRVTSPGVYQPNGSLWPSEPRHAFRGIVLGERAEWLTQIIGENPFTLITTITEILVLENIVGDLLHGDIVELRQMGGIIENHMWSSDWRVEMPIGEEFLIFASDNFREGHWLIDFTGYNFIVPLYNINSIFWISNPDDGRGIGAFTDESILESNAKILGHPEIGSFDITPENMEELANLARNNGIDIGAPIPAEVMEMAQIAIDQRTEDLARWEAEQEEVE